MVSRKITLPKHHQQSLTMFNNQWLHDIRLIMSTVKLHIRDLIIFIIVSVFKALHKVVAKIDWTVKPFPVVFVVFFGHVQNDKDDDLQH